MEAAELATAAVTGRPGELKLLFGNLIDNALCHGPPEGTVRISLVLDGRDSCRARVHDDGGNIPAEHLDRLFERFYRVESSRSRAAGGTGLGLAIARKIVHRHGGDIRIASSPEKGTDVLIGLPRID